MAKKILHGNIHSYLYVDNIAKILAAAHDNGVTVTEI